MKTSIINFFRKLLREKLFSAINIIGLSIGLAVTIMLLLYVTNELSFDRHFVNSKRIVSLNTVWHQNTGVKHYQRNLRRAYSDLPDRVAGIDACAQVYHRGQVELINKPDRFQGLEFLYVDPDFFQIFQLKFIEGTPETALRNPKTLVITRQYADIIFGSTNNAMGKTVLIDEREYTIDAVVEHLPQNTHFSFDILGELESHSISTAQGLEFFTFYLINKDVPVSDVRNSIEKTYTDILSDEFVKWVGEACNGETEMLTDIYLFSQAEFGLGKRSDFKFVLLFSILSIVILLMAVTNFMNLFLAQGETRMFEIGIRKTNGASIGNLIKLFFSEVSLITLAAFILGLLLAIVFAPYFSKLIERDITLVSLINPWFIVGIITVFVITVILSAGYPSFYLSSFNPLDMLANRIHFGKRRLTTMVIIFQSAIAIVLISYVMIVNRQTSYMEHLPIGYNPKNVMMVTPNRTIALAYSSLKQELLNHPEVIAVSASSHTIGGQCSGQTISLPEDATNILAINEYRIMPGLGELMEIELMEGRFFNENDPNNTTSVVLNETAAKLLGIDSPYVGKEVLYKERRRTIIGVTKDFCYYEPGSKVLPLIFTCITGGYYVYIRFNDGTDKASAIEVATKVFKGIDSAYVPEIRWNEDIYKVKFSSVRTHSKIVIFFSLLSIFIAMLGLIAVQSFIVVRRTKEISLRLINGASKTSIVSLLICSLGKLIIVAGIIAIPVAWWFSTNWLSNYVDRIHTGWIVFAVPMIIQCFIAGFVTLGVSLRVLSRNPVEALK